MKQLMIINDKKIRQAAFAEAGKIIKKIDAVTQDLESFKSQDQRLFSEWFDVTFKGLQQQLSERRDELYQLSKFHNWVIAVSQQLGITPPEAFALVEKEERLYQDGSEEVRAQIHELRQKRDRFIAEEIEAEDQFFSEDFFDEPEFKEEPLADNGERDDVEESTFQSLLRLSEDEIAKICANEDSAFELLSNILDLMKTHSESALFLKVWDLTPVKIQKNFGVLFLHRSGVSITRFIQDLRRRLAEDHGPDSDPHFEVVPPSTLPPFELESFKLLYRKLVRLLHPDLNKEEDGQAQWRKQIWNRVQVAYADEQPRALERLYRLVLIRGQRLDQLTVSEILESKHWFNEELKRLNEDIRDFKKSPAWGFSRRKNFLSLKRKLEKPLNEELEKIEVQVEQLKEDRSFLEMMARSKPQRTRPTKKQSARPKKRKKSQDREPWEESGWI